MKTDLDSLMKAQNIDALLITGSAQHNPPMVYMTGIGHVTSADLIKVYGKEPVLFHNSMEREEAARTGLKCVNYADFPLADCRKEAGGDLTRAYAIRYRKMLISQGVEGGTVGIYGVGEVGSHFSIFNLLQSVMPEVKFIGFPEDKILLAAMMTKDMKEIDRIRAVGQATVDIVGRTADFITSHKVKNEIVIKADGSPLTIGEVKSRINLWVAEKGLENPEGTIFAIGRDAGIPHSTGTSSDPLTLGKTIVFDFFPCEAGGGYYYDFTRTWSLGYATDEALKLYEQVKEVYDTVSRELRVNEPFFNSQARTCELFEAMGHPTIYSQPNTENGYNHSLGHGVGLRVHEKPFTGSHLFKSEDLLLPGSVFTLEPGLYYPEKGMGVRLENTVWVKPDGKFEVFADYPMELVLKMKG